VNSVGGTRFRALQPRLRRFIADDRGADIVEYGLLAGIIGVVGLLTFPGLITRMGNTYANWGTQVNGVWIPNPPAP